MFSDFRLIGATSRDLLQDVRTGRFRENFYHRLNVLSIKISPLRERKEDISLLVEYFLKQYAGNLGKRVAGISEADMTTLINYHWPGNVRELKNVIERGTILSSGTRFNIPDLSRTNTISPDDRGVITLADNERQHIEWALKKTNGKETCPGYRKNLRQVPCPGP